MRRLSDTLLTASAVLGVVLCAEASQPAPVSSLEAARDLYVAARYDDALAVLDGLLESGNGSMPDERLHIEHYRSLCLLALGRTGEAEGAIAEVVVRDPLFQPDEYDVPPRLRSAFRDVRRSLLPEIVAREYADARRAYDQERYEDAAEAFRRVSELAGDPDAGGQLDDLKVLASGFAELADAAVVPPEPEPEVEPEPAVAPDRVYGAEDPGIEPPVTIRQAVPPAPAHVSGQIRRSGLLHIVIAETGEVEMLSLRPGVHPVYDRLLLEAAQHWRYEPARIDGRPVKYRKVVRIDAENR